MKTKNLGFYERYKKEQRQKQTEEKFRQKYNISDDKTVIIEKKSKIDKLLHYFTSFTGTTFKVFIYLLIFSLSTIGATVLLNESLRETFVEVIKIIM